ncbi:hypothetical protein IWX90DRAFT_48130 [Phyllosticta citrichinensis]|uniref:Secreted protein n=1 Tax=Phyllosticta citrichinensis TaxID=1130410 RepID=A0ABR1XID6_9PEZI
MRLWSGLVWSGLLWRYLCTALALESDRPLASPQLGCLCFKASPQIVRQQRPPITTPSPSTANPPSLDPFVRFALHRPSCHWPRFVRLVQMLLKPTLPGARLSSPPPTSEAGSFDAIPNLALSSYISTRYQPLHLTP